MSKVVEFIDHVGMQRKEREKEGYQPSSEDRKRRAEIMAQIPADLGLTVEQLHGKLMINRSTWDRWRSMTSVPAQSKLEALLSIAEVAVEPEPAVSIAGFSPLEIISNSPWSYSQLRVMFGAYNWKSAIFRFTSPFSDSDTAVDMAIMAMRGCRIVYVKDDARDWAERFVANLLFSLGKKVTARVLANFCVIESESAWFSHDQNYGILDYHSRFEDRASSIGYIWRGDVDKTDQRGAIGAYSPVIAEDDLFSDLDRPGFHSAIELAYKVIDNRVKKGLVLNVTEDGAFVSIPVIQGKDLNVDYERIVIDISDRNGLKEKINHTSTRL